MGISQCTKHFSLPIAYCLLPIAYCLLPIAYCLDYPDPLELQVKE
jgi:hypothetical protein